MPTDQPSNAPDTIGEDAAEDLTVGTVIADEDLDDAPGGGGLGGAAAARAAERPQPGSTRNAPIDPLVSHDRAPNRDAEDAQGAALDPSATREPHPTSL